MQKLIILAALVACCLAAPSAINKDVFLLRPSPINPDVPMDPKPAEKVIMITDPKEIAKYKRETDNGKEHDPVVPTVLPATEKENHDHGYERTAENNHDLVKHRVKRDSGKPKEKRDNTKVQPLVNKPVQKPAAAVKPKVTPSQSLRKNEPARHEPARHEAVKHRQKRDVAYTASSSTTAIPVDLEHKKETDVTQANAPPPPTVGSVPLLNKNENNAPHVDASENKHSGQEAQVRPQIFPAFLPGAEVNPHALPASVTVKRDIPVPLVAKHKHPEESPKDDDDDDKTSEENSDEESDEKKPKNKKPEENKPTDEHKVQDLKKDDVENLNGAVPLQHPKPISLEQQQKQHTTQTDSEQLAQNSAHHRNNAFIHHEQQEHHFQPQHPHVTSHQDENNTQQKGTTSTAVESTSSTTEHPVLRHKPVPVAELFARQHEKQENSDV